MEGLISNLDIFLKLKQSGSVKNFEFLFNVIKSNFPKKLSDNFEKDLKSFCNKYCYNLQKRWEKSGYKVSTFFKNYSEWLDSDILWPEFIKSYNCDVTYSAPCTSKENISPMKSVATTTLVSTRKHFADLGSKQKKRRTEQLTSTYSVNELSFAQSVNLKASGNEDIAKIVDYLLQNPRDIERVKDFIFSKEKKVLPLEKALGTMLSLKLTKWQYNTLRKITQQENVELFPSYYCIQKAKQECYPSKEDIEISDTSVKIKLQAILDLTANRLLKGIEIKDDDKDLILVSKWGFDGASNQSNYKQKFDKQEDDDDSSIFMGSLVPIKLLCGDNSLWENEIPNSTYYCRPIFFKFMKESIFNVTNEMNMMEAEISSLKDTTSGGKTISHSLMLTMIDGKITSILSGTSTQRCDICNATPKEMNNLDLIATKAVDTDLCKYGMSSLHSWIRFMECILHISYRLEFKTWIAKNENKILMEAKKREVQEHFKRQTGLLIDIVKQGHGTTNDGNTARRFFADSATSASITGVDENLIRRFSVILETLSSGFPINAHKFKVFADQTIHVYIELYNWYYMPASVHKILAHGKDIIENFGLIPIGKLSEEASESRNKDFRRYRQHHSRKFSRKATNEDIINNLLLTSDPYISQRRSKLIREHKVLSKDAQSLLLFTDESEGESGNIETFAFVDMDLTHESESEDCDQL